MKYAIIKNNAVVAEFDGWRQDAIKGAMQRHGEDVSLQSTPPTGTIGIGAIIIRPFEDPGPNPPAGQVLQSRTVNTDGTVTYTYRDMTQAEIDERRKDAIREVYRRRKEGYTAVLDKGPPPKDSIQATGHVIDALISQLATAAAAGEITLTTEMQDIITAVQAVKSELPLPE